MKKLVILLLGVFLSISLTSCVDDETIIDPLNPDTETPDAPDKDQDDDAPDVNARKILIVYFHVPVTTIRISGLTSVIRHV